MPAASRAQSCYHAPDLDRYERNNCACRRLDPELVIVDRMLQAWAPWARPVYAQLGYPRRSVTERGNEGGILATDMRPPPSPEWPGPMVAVDAAVARLSTRFQAAIFATYFHAGQVLEVRARIFGLGSLHDCARSIRRRAARCVTWSASTGRGGRCARCWRLPRGRRRRRVEPNNAARRRRLVELGSPRYGSSCVDG
jgi:hypothetical protein